MSNPAQGAVGAARVCHKEQMTIWSGEIVSRLNMGGYFRDDLSYDDIVDINAAVSEEIRSIAGTAFALATPRTDSDEGTAGAILTEACKPWEHYTGEPPDDGSPLSGVFVAGMAYTERLLAKLLDVTHYEGGDGSEDFDNDATQTLRNILTGASLWDADENTAADIQNLREEVAYWRADLASRLWTLRGLYTTARAKGEPGRAIDLGNLIRGALHSFRDAEASEWHDRCEICGEFILPGEAQASDDEISGHARCLTEGGVGYVHPHGREDLAEQVKKSEALLGEPWTFAPGTFDPATPAPATPPGVPDSLRALSEAATAGPWAATYQEYDDWGVIRTTVEDGNGFHPVVCAARVMDDQQEQSAARSENRQPRICGANAALIVYAVNRLRAEISTHPAGQSTGQDDPVEAVARALYEHDNRGLSDVWAWDADGLEAEHPGLRERYERQAAAALKAIGAEETEDDLDRRIARTGARENMQLIDGIADLFEAGRRLITEWGDAPELPEEIENALARFEKVWLALDDGKPAPDSTRTGPVGADELLLRLRSAFDSDRIADKNIALRQAYDALAARPAAPEAQGAWRVGCEQLYLDASAAIEGVAQELEAIDRTASAKMLRNALDTLLGVEPNATLPAADDATKRIVAHAWERFQRGVSGHADKDGGHERRACENCGGQKHTDMGTTVCSVCAGTGVETAVDSTIEAGTARGLDRAPPSAQEAWRSQAANDVLAERRRQIEAEGWTAEHDDTHSRGELASAAACYATELDLWTGYEQADRKGRATLISAERVWPWSGWWKPTDRRRNLVKAGALILAEIERLDRLPAPPSSGQGGR